MMDQRSTTPAFVSHETFQARLAALESWLWGEGARQLGLGALPRPAALAQRVVTLSDLYTTGRASLTEQANKAAHLSAKLLYFLPSDAPKIFLILRELSGRYPALWKPGRTLRLIDAGAGVGATSVGLLLSLEAVAFPRVEIHAVDAEAPMLRHWTIVARQAAKIAGIDLQAHAQTADLRDPAALDLPRSWDLLVAQAVLNELFGGDAPVEALERSAAWVGGWANQGLSIFIEPALRVTTRSLQAVRDRVVAGGGVRVLAPCPHQGPCPMLANERDWCHEVRLVAPTPKVAEIQAITRRRDERTKFSFMALAPAKWMAVAPLPPLAGRLVSDSLSSKGKTERWLCSGRGQLVRLRLLDRDKTPENAAIADAERGTLVRIEGSPALPRLAKETVVRREIE